jgi:hypothetical protein
MELDQCCQIFYFQTKNPDLGTFWRALEWKMLLYFVTFQDNLWPFGMYGSLVCIIYGSLVYFFQFWYVWTKKNLATLNWTLIS